MLYYALKQTEFLISSFLFILATLILILSFKGIHPILLSLFTSTLPTNLPESL